MLGIVGAMIGAPNFTGVDVEQRIIAEELQDEIDASGRDVDPDNLAKMKLFPGSSMGLKVGGTLAGIKRFGAADCRRWHERFYGAANMVLSIAGPVQLDTVLEAAAQAFGQFPTGSSQATRPASVRTDLPAFEYPKPAGPQADPPPPGVPPPAPHPRLAAPLRAPGPSGGGPAGPRLPCGRRPRGL